MAGSPIKRARKLGLLPPAPPRRLSAQARAIVKSPLPPDSEIAEEAKRTLITIMQRGMTDGARATAARVLLEATRDRSGSSPSSGLERLSDEQVAQLSIQASLSVSVAPVASPQPQPQPTSIEAGDVPATAKEPE